MEPLSPGARAALDAYRREHAPRDLAVLQRALLERVHAERRPAPKARYGVPAGAALVLATILGIASLPTPPAKTLPHELDHPRRDRAVPALSIPPEPMPDVVPTLALPRAKAPAPARSMPEPMPEPAPPRQAEGDTTTHVALTRSVTSDWPATPPPSSSPAIREDQSLDAEVMQVRTAYDLIRTHQPLRALSALREHRRRFPDGELRELADAARVLALCEAGQHQVAQQAREAFLRSYASSIHASRVREACEE